MQQHLVSPSTRWRVGSHLERPSPFPLLVLVASAWHRAQNSIAVVARVAPELRGGQVLGMAT